MKLNNDGITRHVILVGRWAVKVPRLNYGWQKFLYGLLSNMQEAAFGKRSDMMEGICPTYFSFPGGFLNIQPRCDILSEEEYKLLHITLRRMRKNGLSCVEDKHDSWGWLRTSKFGSVLVAVDIGNVT